MTWDIVLVAFALIGGWFSIQFGWWRPTVAYRFPRILMYHMVTNHKPRARFNKLRVAPEEFSRQMHWLATNGWQFRFMSELESASGEKNVFLTFDDGYRDNLLVADPILRECGAKATLFLVADRHDRDWSSAKKSHHDDGELMHEPKLLDEDVKHMLESGRWEIGGHTLTHGNLANANERTRRIEIGESKSQLEDAFSTSVDSFAYPFGIFSGEDLHTVRSSGYACAVTTEQGIPKDFSAQRFSLPRVKISGNDGMFAFRLRMRTGKCRLRS